MRHINTLWIFIVIAMLLGTACVTSSLKLSPATRVYAMEREFNDLYLPPINRYAAKDFCDATASPPVTTNCADARTVITLNNVAQEAGAALASAQTAVRKVSTECKQPDSPLCTDAQQALIVFTSIATDVLVRVSVEFVKAGLDK